MISGKTKVFFMVADPINHVRAPEVLNHRFEATGLNAVMVPCHFSALDFPAAWAAMKCMQNLGGLVVSVPLKELAFDLSDEISDSARKIGVANVIRREPDSRMIAANFDGLGFIVGMLSGGADAAGRHALLLGAGGAGRAIAIYLAEHGVLSLRIHDINVDKARELSAELQLRYPHITVQSGLNEVADADLLVNATPLGLQPNTDPLPVDVTQLHPAVLVADIVMKPRETPLITAARAAGCEVRYGDGMLDSQLDLMLDHLLAGSRPRAEPWKASRQGRR